MSFEPRTHVSATSKLPNTVRLSTVANVIWQIGTLIVMPRGKSAMSWGIDGLKWSVLTLVVEYEQAVRYGVVLGWRADRLAHDAATPSAAGDANPS